MKIPLNGNADPAPRAGLDATTLPSQRRGTDEALPPALSGQRIGFGGLNCYVAGQGPPLVLLHSVNAAASAAEMRPLFDHYRSTRTVFALDLPGFGFSDRSDRAYTPRLMTDALHALSHQIRLHCGAAPIDALALSLGCEFLARAASEQPTHWGRLALVSPTGFKGLHPRQGAPGSTHAVPGLHALLSLPLWAGALYRGLTRPAVVRYFLQRSWGRKAIDEALWAYDVQLAHQPGARHAPLAFLSGGLFSADILGVYESLKQPVWASHGVRGDFTDYRALVRVRGRPNWCFSVFQTGALPYFEQPAEFCAAFGAFLGTVAGRRPVRAQVGSRVAA